MGRTAASWLPWAHIMFVVSAVVDIRILLKGFIGEAIFWGLATLSCYHIGSIIAQQQNEKYLVDAVQTGVSNSKLRDGSASSASSASSEAIKNRKRSKSKNRCKDGSGLQILIARWGTHRKEIDVTKIVQQMVSDQGGSELRIPKSLSFNKIFGDPLPFRRKKLRIVALVNGMPYVDAVREKRSKDFVITAPEEPQGCVLSDTDGANIEANIDEADGRSDDLLQPSNVAISCHPVMSQMTESFSLLAESLPFTELKAEDVVDAVDRVGEMITLFGASMLPVRTSVTDNVVKIRKQLSLIKARDANADTRLSSLILADVSRGEGKKEGSVCLSGLWMKRCMDFQLLFLKRIIDGADSYAAAKEALDATLVPWQGFLLRTTCRTGMKMIPTRAKIISALLANGGKGIDADEGEAAVIDAMRKLLAGFSVVLLEWNNFVMENNLNYPEKA